MTTMWGPTPQTWRRRRKKEENKEMKEGKELTQEVELSRRTVGGVNHNQTKCEPLSD